MSEAKEGISPNFDLEYLARDFDCAVYANLVNSNTVRSVRFGANWNNGNVNLNANNAPSNSNANYGGDLWNPSIGSGIR